MSNLKKSIVSSLVVVSFALFSPFLYDSSYINRGSWNICLQFIALWLLVTIAIFQINKINEKT